MFNGLLSSLKKPDTFGPSIGKAMPTQRGMIGPPNPLFDQSLGGMATPTTRGAIEQNTREIMEAHDKYQKILDKLFVAIENRAMVKPQLPAPMQVSGKEAMYAGAIQAIAKALGARDNYVQGAGKQYFDTREAMMNEDNQRALQQANLDYTGQMNMANADVTNLQMGLDHQGNRISGLEGLNKNLTSTLNTEITQGGITGRNDANIASRFTLEELKQYGEMRIKEFVDDPAKHRRAIESLTEMYMRLGNDEKTAYLKAFETATSQELFKMLQAKGQGIKNDFDEKANPAKLEGLNLDNAQSEANIDRTKAQTANTKANTEYTKERTKYLGKEFGLRMDRFDLDTSKFLNELSGKSDKELVDKEKEIRTIRGDLTKKAEDYRKEIRSLQSDLAKLSDSDSAGTSQAAVLQNQIAELNRKVLDIQNEYQRTTESLNAVKESKKKAAKPTKSSRQNAYDAIDPFQADPSLKGRIGR